MSVTWHQGDTLAVLADMAAADTTVDLAITSPPFFALRDYNGIEGQHGSESSPVEWLATQLDVIEAVGRVLAPHGSIAWEVGDTYAGSGGGGGDYLPGGWRDGQPNFAGSAATAREGNAEHWRRKNAAKDQQPLAKSLCGTPQALMLSLAYGRNILALPGQGEWREFAPWRVRNLVAWVRTNPTVGALGDKWRPATSYITVATRSARRWWDEVATRTGVPCGAYDGGPTEFDRRPGKGREDTTPNPIGNPNGAPLLDWWQVNSPGTAEAHYAVWPPEICRRLILAMCPAGGTVLDPYSGSGTTLAVADHLGRDAIGIDLDPHNINHIWPRRRAEVARQLTGAAKPPTQIDGQLDIFKDATA